MDESSPELAALIRFSDPTESKPAPIEAEEFDWQRFVELGSAHGVLPSIQRHRDSLELDAPGWVLDRIATEHRSTAARNLLFNDTLAEVTERLGDADIRMLAYKGPVLSEAVYPDRACREFGDLDLLVERDAFERAVATLEAAGFEAEVGSPPPRSATTGGIVRPPMLEEYSMHRAELEVELRWRIGDTDRPFRPGFETLWARRDGVTVGGRLVPTLNPIDRLQMLAFHGTKHRWHQLKWVADFQAAMHASEVPSKSVVDRAAANGNRRRVLLGVSLINEIYRTPVPPDIESLSGRDHLVAKMTGSVLTELQRTGRSQHSSFDRLVTNLAAADTMVDRLRMLALYRPLHPTPAEYQWQPIPESWYSLYYLLRPVRLAAVMAVNARR